MSEYLAALLFTGILAGIGIGALDALALARAHDMFFDAGELSRAILYTMSIDIGVAVLMAAAASVALRASARGLRAAGFPEAPAWRAALLAALLLGPTLFTLLRLTSGPQASQMPGRLGIVLAASVITAGCLGAMGAILPRILRTPRRRSIAGAVGLSGALVVHAVDATVLVRLYPIFHDVLTMLAFLLFMVAVHLLSPPLGRLVPPRAIGIAALLLTIGGALSMVKTLGTQNIRFVVLQETTHATDILTAAEGIAARCAPAPSQEAATSGPEHLAVRGGISRPGSDLFLITVDALRYDRLKKTGAARAVMPNVDALAERSILFTHAYTPIPHTSYAITSLLTGKYTRPLFGVPGAPDVHDTWPEIMRHFRYETSAFFPPAVFFIDREKFRPYYEKGVGFLYKHVDARVTAREKVTLLIDHVKEKKTTGRPHFAWIHFFEAHEPYDVSCTRFGTAPKDRYDCELHAVDSALEALFAYLDTLTPEPVVILTADHGEAFGEHGDSYHGTSLYDEQVRVPLLIRIPGIPHRVIDTPVSIVDLLGTALSVLDIPIPARVRSRDLTALLDAPLDLDAFTELRDEAAVVFDGHKLICNTATDLCRLYDLKTDPGETRSVAEQQPEKLAEMKRRLSAWRGSHAPYELRPIKSRESGETERWPLAIQQALAGDAESAPRLLSVLRDAKEPVIRRKAAALFYRLSDEPPPDIALQDQTDPVVTAWLAASAVRRGEGSALPLLRSVSAALPTDAPVSRAVVLTRIAAGDWRAVPEAVALALADDAPIEERREALRHLGAYQKGDFASVRLIPLIDNYQLTLDVAALLGKLDTKAAVMPLIARLQRERFEERKAAIIDALAAIGDWRAVAAIADQLHNDPPPRNALAALDRIVRPSPNGRRLPSEQRGQESLYVRPLTSTRFALFFEAVYRVLVKTDVASASARLHIQCNGHPVGSLTLPYGKAEHHVDIGGCPPGTAASTFDLIKSDGDFEIEAVVFLGPPRQDGAPSATQ